MSTALEAPDTGTQGTSLAENAYLLLRDRLIMLDIKPGDPINDGQAVIECRRISNRPRSRAGIRSPIDGVSIPGPGVRSNAVSVAPRW